MRKQLFFICGRVDKMKHATLMIKSLLALYVLIPVLASGAGNCEPVNPQLDTAQRTAYIKQCLAELSSPANVKKVAMQQKKMSCEQNARNKALQDAAQANYVSACINSNEAKEAAEVQAAGLPKKLRTASLE